MITDYFEFIQSRIDYSLVEGKQVVVDPGNGAASGFLTQGLEAPQELKPYLESLLNHRIKKK